jgi:hypothetical protein
MMCRIWRGWTTAENSSRNEPILREEVILAIGIQRIPGFLSIGLWSAPAYAGSCEHAA